MISYDVNQEPLVISKSIIDLFLKEDNVIDLIALYNFYYYTAKWQKTNQCKCTDTYAREGLNMPRKRFMEAKKFLLNNNLIEKIQHRTKKDKKVSISGWYVKVNFMWTREKVNKVISMYNSESRTSSPVNKYSHEQVQPETTNALSGNNLNASSDNNKNALNNNKSNFDIAFDDFKEMRRKVRAPMTKRAEGLIIKELDKLSDGNEELKTKILEQSIANSWKGVFPIKKKFEQLSMFKNKSKTAVGTLTQEERDELPF